MKRKIKFLVYPLTVIAMSLLIICCSDDDPEPINPPTLTTLAVTDITKTSAKSGGNITDDGGGEITARGVVWNTEANPTLENQSGVTVDGTGSGIFQSNIIGLSAETTYFVRAYATNSAGTSYGNDVMFETAADEDDDNGDDDNGDPDIIYGDGVTDIDGNVYVTVIIGDQEWMAENLRVTRYKNGVAMSMGLSNAEWGSTTSGAFAIYPHEGGVTEDDVEGINSDAEMVAAYGKLYNFYAVNDSRGLCPEGWSIPSDDDWTQLVDYAVAQGFPDSNVTNGAGNALRSCREINSPLGGDCNTKVHPRWYSHGPNHGFDEFGFSALPGGYRYYNGPFYHIGTSGNWWSSTEDSSTSARSLSIHYVYGNIHRSINGKGRGFSVRCLRLTADPSTHNLNLSVSPTGSGTVTGAGQYAAGTQVNISANASTGWEFVNWTGNTEYLDNPNSESAIVTMPAQNVILNANFQQTETPGVVTQIDEDFQGYDNYDPINQNGWSTFAEEGSRVWICRMFQGNHYAQTTAFNSSDSNNIMWMITPPVNLDASTSPVLEFQSAHEYLTHDAVQLYISSDFDGNNPWDASWTMLDAQLAAPSDDFHAWIDSGVISLGSHSGIVHIAWRYEGSHPNGTNGSFRVNNVLLYDAAK